MRNDRAAAMVPGPAHKPIGQAFRLVAQHFAYWLSISSAISDSVFRFNAPVQLRNILPSESTNTVVGIPKTRKFRIIAGSSVNPAG